MNYSKIYGLQPADRIIEPIFQTGLSKHHAIYLGIDQNGVEWISENYKFEGVRMIPAAQYFKPDGKYEIERFDGDFASRIIAVKRALKQLGKPYDLISYNCEHYANYVQTGKSESSQVNNVLTGIGLVAAAVVVAGVIDNIVND